MDDTPTTGYEFVKLSEDLARTLLAAAQEQVAQANAILDQTQSIADVIVTQVRAHAKQIEERNGRLKAFGAQMLDAHRQLNGDLPRAPDRLDGLANATPVSSGDLAKLRALAGNYGGRVNPPGIGTIDPSLTIDSKRANDPAYRAPDPARQGGGLPLALADLDKFRVNRTDPGQDRRDPTGTGSAGS